MPRGKKKCQCNKEVGPRTLVCPNCGYDFGINRKKYCKDPVKKLEYATAKTKRFSFINDWKELEEGDIVKVVAGSGPYINLSREKEDGSTTEYMGYSGLFKVKSNMRDGLLCYPTKAKQKDSGACFIYMGPEREGVAGSILRPHKLYKVRKKNV